MAKFDREPVSDEEHEEYCRRRDEALASGHEVKIRLFLKRYGMTWPKEPEAFWAHVEKHKANPYVCVEKEEDWTVRDYESESAQATQAEFGF